MPLPDALAATGCSLSLGLPILDTSQSGTIQWSLCLPVTPCAVRSVHAVASVSTAPPCTGGRFIYLLSPEGHWNGFPFVAVVNNAPVTTFGQVSV